MAPKRTRSTLLSDDQSRDEDVDYEEEHHEEHDGASSCTTSRTTSTSTKRRRSPSPVPGDVVKRHAAAGLPPRGRLFGGLGLIPDEELAQGRQKPNEVGESQPPSIRTKSIGDKLLVFKPTKPRVPQKLDFLRSEVLMTTREADDNSDSEDEGGDDEKEDDTTVISVSKIVNQSERVQRAIVGGPCPQVPWILNRFGSFPKRTRSSSKENTTDVEEGTPRKRAKKDKSKPSKPTRSFKDSDNTSILLYHGTSLNKLSKLSTYKTVVTHQADGEGKLNANFFWIVYTEPITQRLHLRIAITSANPTRESYSNSENTVWMQDFPELDDMDESKKNPTHTAFSKTFLGFIGGGLGLPSNSKCKSFIETEACFDFTRSSDVRAVVSVAGEYSGRELEYVGGFDSLAKAVASLRPEASGAWRIEYITATSLPINEEFLKNLFAACLGVSPVELAQHATVASKFARQRFSREKIKLGYPKIDTVEQAEGNKIGRYALKFETAGDLEFDRLADDDARGYYEDDNGNERTIMHDLRLKSNRVNHSNVLVILHVPLSKSSTDFEAFVYFGSHSPTFESWGEYYTEHVGTTKTVPRVKVANSELGVVVRVTADSWNELVADVNELVPYDRSSLRPYLKVETSRNPRGHVPFPTPEPRVSKSSKGQKEEE